MLKMQKDYTTYLAILRWKIPMLLISHLLLRGVYSPHISHCSQNCNNQVENVTCTLKNECHFRSLVSYVYFFSWMTTKWKSFNGSLFFNSHANRVVIKFIEVSAVTSWIQKHRRLASVSRRDTILTISGIMKLS